MSLRSSEPTAQITDYARAHTTQLWLSTTQRRQRERKDAETIKKKTKGFYCDQTKRSSEKRQNNIQKTRDSLVQ